MQYYASIRYANLSVPAALCEVQYSTLGNVHDTENPCYVNGITILTSGMLYLMNCVSDSALSMDVLVPQVSY